MIVSRETVSLRDVSEAQPIKANDSFVSFSMFFLLLSVCMMILTFLFPIKIGLIEGFHLSCILKAFSLQRCKMQRLFSRHDGYKFHDKFIFFIVIDYFESD